MSEFIPNRPSGTAWAGDAPEDAPEPFVAPPPRPQTPGRRPGGTVELSDGGATAVFTDHEVAGHPGVYVPDQAPVAPKVADASPPVFMKAGTDSRMLAKDVGMSDLVDLGGILGVTTVGSALHNNWLEERDGGYVKINEAAPPKPARKVTKATKPAVDDADADDADAGDTDTAPDTKSTEPPAAAREYLRHEDEAFLREAETAVGKDTYAAVEAFLTENMEVPDDLMARVASTVGGDREAARQVLASAVEPFYQQAASVVDRTVPGNSELVFDWARSDPKGKEMFKEAMKLQTNERSTAGYTKLARAYLADLAVKNPQAVVEGIRAGGNKASILNGDVFIDLGGKRGKTSFVGAMKAGLI
jgi:hypothetical protein